MFGKRTQAIENRLRPCCAADERSKQFGQIPQLGPKTRPVTVHRCDAHKNTTHLRMSAQTFQRVLDHRTIEKRKVLLGNARLHAGARARGRNKDPNDGIGGQERAADSIEGLLSVPPTKKIF
jgi:hypothetical protein